MTLDRFGDELYIGDIVVYADWNASGEISLDVYLVKELIDTHTCMGQLINGEWAGNNFYLSETTSRCAFVSEYAPVGQRPEEDDEDSTDLVRPTLN